MHKLSMAGIPLPEVYVCRTRTEAEPLVKAGIPYFITDLSDLDIIKVILFRTLKRKFPHIKWESVLGISESLVWRTNVFVPGGFFEATQDDGSSLSGKHTVSDIAESERVFKGRSTSTGRIMEVDDFFEDAASKVNIEQLQDLKLLPKFMDDAADAIKVNLENRIRWHECFNKKLGACVGDYDYSMEAGNLIILDISGSIPEGISATMIQLIATLVSQTDADLIITAGQSKFYPHDAELPEPRKIRSMFGYGNESEMFIGILKSLQNKHYSNVISFGDNDTPCYNGFIWLKEAIKVDKVIHYHTYDEKAQTGYAKWVLEMNPDVEVVHDISWCEVMKK